MKHYESKPGNQLSDEALLAALLAASDRLDEWELGAFANMRTRLQHPLTPKQRQSAERAYDRLDLAAEQTLNLVSTGQVERGRVPTFDWEKNRPLKPPGRT